MKQFGGKWWPLESGAFAVLFVWLRWYTPLWQNRWTGFFLGVAFVLAAKSLNWRDSALQHLQFKEKYGFPDRATFVSALVLPIMGVLALKGWLFGHPVFFSSGVKAASDNGMFAVLILATAPSYLYASWMLLRKKSSHSPQDPYVTQNHG